MTAHWQSFAEALAGHLLNSVVEGIAIALVGSLFLRMLGKQNSGTRFLLLFSALGAVVALPILESLVPGIGPARATIHSALNLPASWAADIVLVWAVIAAAGLAKIGLGFWQLRKLRRSCVPVELEDVDPTVRATWQQFGSGRNVALRTSEDVRVPTAIGFTKPTIVIPAWALTELTPIELNAIVLHELAHLRRRDDWTNLAQKIVRAILFFHPAVWWLGRGLAREREMACDDFVLSATPDRRAYAQCLVSVAEKTFLRRGLALAQALVGRVQLTAQRVARILASDRPAAVRVWKPAFGVVAAFSTVCLVALPRVPRFIAFDPPASVTSIANAAPTFAARTSAEASKFGVKMIPASFNGLSEEKRVPARILKPPAPNKIATNKIAANKIASLRAENRDQSDADPAFESADAQQPTRRSQQPQITNAGFRASAAQPSAVLVMMQTNRVDEYGQVWSVCVWQLTVFHPTEKALDQSVRKGIAPKST